MGSVKREYGLREYDLKGTTRTVREWQAFFPLIHSSVLTARIMDVIYQKIRRAVTKKKEIDHRFIILRAYHSMYQTVQGYNRHVLDYLGGKVDFFYIPTIGGGDNYNSNCKVAKENQHFGFDVVHIAVGVVYKTIYSNFVRTLLINPTERITYNYNFLMLVQRAVAYYLRDGVKLCEVYQSAMAFAEYENRHLAAHLDKHFGFALNPILQEDLHIYPHTKATAYYGMTFTMNARLKELVEAGRVYILCAGDTVLVRKDEPAEVITYKYRIRDTEIIEVPNS